MIVNVNQQKKELSRFKINTMNCICMVFLYILMVIIYYDKNAEFDYGIRGYLVFSVLYLLMYHIFNSAFGAYKVGNRKILDISLSQGMSIIICDIVMFFVLSLIEGHILYLKWPYFCLILIQVLLSVLFNYFGTLYIRNNFKPLNAIAIHDSLNYQEIIDKLKVYQQYEFNINKIVNEKEIENSDFDSLFNNYECVICIEVSHEVKNKVVNYCYENNTHIFDVPNVTDVIIKSSVITSLIDTPIFKINKFGPNIIESIVKRAMDIFGGILLLIIGSPFMLISTIIIKLQDGGEIFFKQKRLTKDGKVFEMIKFRSMIMNAEPDGKMIPAKENDDRITKYGRFMRRTRIDEIPQVFNILKGDMSFVGPRALRIEEYEENKDSFPEFRYRLKVKAGLSGYAQLYGKYNTSFKDKLLFDLYYIENYSLIEDIKLILMSFINIFRKDSTQGFHE